MEERSEDFREALSNIARHARSLLQNFSDSNVQPSEQRMLDQRPRESGVLSSTRTPSSSQNVDVNNRNVGLVLKHGTPERRNPGVLKPGTHNY